MKVLVLKTIALTLLLLLTIVLFVKENQKYMQEISKDLWGISPDEKMRFCEYDNPPTEDQFESCYLTCFDAKTSGFFGLTSANMASASTICTERCEDFFGCKPYYKSFREIMEESE